MIHLFITHLIILYIHYSFAGIITCITIFGPAMAYGLGGFFSQIYVTLEGMSMYPHSIKYFPNSYLAIAALMRRFSISS